MAEEEKKRKAKAVSNNQARPTKKRNDQRLLINNQVQCVNAHCKSGNNLSEAPVFVLTYFGVPYLRDVLQKVCEDCFCMATQHQRMLARLLKERKPLLLAQYPSRTDDVVTMEPEDEIYEEEVLPSSVINEVENHLMSVIADVIEKYDIDYQMSASQKILGKKFKILEEKSSATNEKLSKMQKKINEMWRLIYKDFTPKNKSLPTLHIIMEGNEGENVWKSTVSRPDTPESTPPSDCDSAQPDSVNPDVVALQEVEVSRFALPPTGPLVYPNLSVGSRVYIMKVSSLGIWLMGTILDIHPKTNEGGVSYRVRFDASGVPGESSKMVTGKQIAYSGASPVRLPVGTRVIANFQHSSEDTGSQTMYVGVIVEPAKNLNKYRYLVFFDDGYAQYVSHEKIRLVCEASKPVWEDVEAESREFIKTYLTQYPERPMVKLQKGQILMAEYNEKWQSAEIMEVDGSLAKLHFESENRTEWLYRGSSRLGPLYSDMVAASSRKEKGASSRHRSLGISSLKKRNMPYVEYRVDEDDSKSETEIPVAPASRNVAKKSTTKKNEPDNKNGKSPNAYQDESVDLNSKGYIRTIDLSSRLPSRRFIPHQCSSSCIKWTNYSESACKGKNPLIWPLLYGFERQITKVKSARTRMLTYITPCGRRIRSMAEMHRYLRVTKSRMGIDLFDFDYWVRILEEFHLESNSYFTIVKDISYGRENVPVSCVNEINNSWAVPVEYTTARIPQEGVNICLDEEFLVCCSCVDDCRDKAKCECWQLTIQGTKLGPDQAVDPSVGYQFKRLPEPVTTGIYECNSRCKCSSTCLNRVAQFPLKQNLQVFKTKKKGWGLRTLHDIPMGGFVCIYAGRLHTEQGANDDGRMYGDEYLAELDYIEVVERFKEDYEAEAKEPVSGRDAAEEEDDDDIQATYVKVKGNVAYDMDSTKTAEESSFDDENDEMKRRPSKFAPSTFTQDNIPSRNRSVREMFGDGNYDCYVMDAKITGNIGRFLNHSCQPNVFVQNVFVDTHDVRFPWVAFFALNHIKAGTELTWDYNYDVGSVSGKVLYCYCNSVECRGRLL